MAEPYTISMIKVVELVREQGFPAEMADATREPIIAAGPVDEDGYYAIVAGPGEWIDDVPFGNPGDFYAYPESTSGADCEAVATLGATTDAEVAALIVRLLKNVAR
ncbi:hypothetical protein [Amycolatopsis sp. DSM 110486]|uniref:hypothetical protein n=1 Tax=Amycolatopsis sp. DSM 110486 TaxID=2865832 RepID=UPI001C6A6C30|nr:hypothetical protein [Amycolatopsis sp. DSM 110486]QYN17537.1 hypothetical protein K1T34_32650 [Amycolatopsis sp. DSM 110486]